MFFLLTAQLPAAPRPQKNSVKAPASFACSPEEIAGRMQGSNPAPMVIPTLQRWTGGNGTTHLSSQSRIVLEPRNAKALEPLGKLLASELKGMTGLSLPVAAASIIAPGDIALSLSPCGAQTRTSIGSEGNTLLLRNAIVVRANTSRGAFYGTRTLLQLLMLAGTSSAKSQPSVPQGFSIDSPRYATRSVMLDAGRMFLSPEFLEDTMRFMSWYKLNTLHLHLNDQADAIDASGHLNYPFVVKAFRLKSDQAKFANLIPADGKAYTRRDWDQMEEVAARYGIDIVPEIDTPGHAAAFTRARPDLQLVTGNTHDTSILDVRKPETLSYIESVFAEFLPWFHSRQIHIGGDEVSGIPVADQVRYLNALNRYLRSKGKTVSIWGAEAEPEFAGGLDKNITVQWWSGAKNDWSEAGFRNINSPFSMYLLPKPGDRSAPHSLSGEAVYTKWEASINQQHPPSGGQICVWNDWAVMGYPESYVKEMVRDAIPAAAQMFWTGYAKDAAGAVIPYAVLQKSVNVLQPGPAPLF